MIIRCQRCRKFRNARVWPFTCACGELLDERDAVDASGQLPSSRAGRAARASRQPLIRATKLCIRCEAFPCLGANDCRHEKAMRGGENCPRGVWLWV